jgi:hypothetical protein
MANGEDGVEIRAAGLYVLMPTAVAAVYTCIRQTMHMHIQINL